MEIKLSFLGDVTCDRPMLKAAKVDGKFDFDKSLQGIKPLLMDSDYVVANLETVFAGEKYGYNPNPVSYNSPDALADALKNAGITMVTTANNHCLDMGGHGIDRTIDVLDTLGIEHTGTLHFKEVGTGKRYLVKNIQGIRVAFVSLTDCLNVRADGTVHSEAEWNQLNNLRKRKACASGNPAKEFIKKILPMKKINAIRAEKMRKQGIALVTPRVDDFAIPEEDCPQIEWAIELLKQARAESDFVIACVHCGGQFNYEPGKHSVQLYDLLEPYADAIIGNHPHVIQRIERHGDKIRAYSLGGVNLSESADYVAKDTDFQYSMLLHLNISKNENSTVLNGFDYALLCAREDENHYVLVEPQNELSACDNFRRKVQDDL